MKKIKKNTQVNFKQGKTPREELELPKLHFVVMDNWINVIGEKALFAWLKMFTWADRTNAKEDPSLWNESKIPRSLNKIAKDLGVGKDTFYNKILKPLWNVGLIDLEEYEESDTKGNKPMNIIIYKYPQNDFALSVKPLELVRDYDRDYSSEARTFALRKATIKQEKTDGSDSEPGVVLEQNQGWFQDRTRDGSEPEHNNNLNNTNNTFNDINNNLNPNPIKINKYEVLWNIQIPQGLKIRIKNLLANGSINLSVEQILLIEDAYNYQVQRSYVIPDCDANYSGALNDLEFSNTVIKMLEKVKVIKNLRGLIKEWVQLAFEHKLERLS
jgi:hypothetical protein